MKFKSNIGPVEVVVSASLYIAECFAISCSTAHLELLVVYINKTTGNWQQFL